MVPSRLQGEGELAALYGVPTKALNQALRRNLERFPDDFAFQLSKDDLENWRSQIVTSNSSAKMGLRRERAASVIEVVVEDIDRLGRKVEQMRPQEPAYTRRRIGYVTDED